MGVRTVQFDNQDVRLSLFSSPKFHTMSNSQNFKNFQNYKKNLRDLVFLSLMVDLSLLFSPMVY